MKRKFFGTLLIAVCLLGLCACGVTDDTKESTKKASKSSAETREDEQITGKRFAIHTSGRKFPTALVSLITRMPG